VLEVLKTESYYQDPEFESRSCY